VGVNLSAGFNPARYTYDGVHPNEQGERWIAKRYYKKLAGILRALTR
jgi:lysophospholipase L1-like esterase